MKPEKRLKTLIENHEEHFRAIMLNFAQQVHEILSEIDNPNAEYVSDISKILRDEK